MWKKSKSILPEYLNSLKLMDITMVVIKFTILSLSVLIPGS